MTKLLAIALAGAAGTLCRYGLGNLITRLAGEGFPWGTLVANVVGCLVFGVVLSLGEGRLGLGQPWRGILLVGFMGAFTTFSTYAADTALFLRDGPTGYAIANILASNVLGVLALFAGLAIGRSI